MWMQKEDDMPHALPPKYPEPKKTFFPLSMLMKNEVAFTGFERQSIG